MQGTIDIRARPLRLAYLVSPNSTRQVLEAMRLSSSLWGGFTFPILPVYRRLPRTWKDPTGRPSAKTLLMGYLRAFDPDILVQLCSSLPSYVNSCGLKILKPSHIWQSLE